MPRPARAATTLQPAITLFRRRDRIPPMLVDLPKYELHACQFRIRLSLAFKSVSEAHVFLDAPTFRQCRSLAVAQDCYETRDHMQQGRTAVTEYSRSGVTRLVCILPPSIDFQHNRKRQIPEVRKVVLAYKHASRCQRGALHFLMTMKFA
jgi:hypothetical protein